MDKDKSPKRSNRASGSDHLAPPGKEKKEKRPRSVSPSHTVANQALLPNAAAQKLTKRKAFKGDETAKKDSAVLVLHQLTVTGLESSADPYFIVTSGNWKYETPPKKNVRDAKWLPYFCFPFESVGTTIRFQLMDDNALLPDTKEGSFEVDVAPLLASIGKKHDVESQGTFLVGSKHRKVNYWMDWKYESWPNAFPKLADNERQAAIKKPELFLRGAHFAITLQIEKWVPITCESIPPPREPKGKQRVIVELDGAFFTLAKDPDVPIPPEADILIGMLNQLPFDDENTLFANKSEATDYVHRLFGAIIIPPNEGLWEDLTGDNAMSRYFFENNGSLFLSKSSDGYLCDLDWLKQFKTRKPYLAYGGKTYFDTKGKITHIVYDGKKYVPNAPGADSKDWEFMKLVSRTSAFIAASGIHLMQGHLKWSNYPNYAMRTALEPDHPVRRLLHPHFWRSAMVCAKSLKSLIPEKGLVHRGTAFEIDGLRSFFKFALANFKFDTFPEDLKKRGMDQAGDMYPACSDGMLFWKAFQKYVGGFIDIHYADEAAVSKDSSLADFWKILQETMQGTPNLNLANLKTVLAEIIFRVTSWHQHIGNAIAPINDPACVALRLTPGVLISSVQSLFAQGLVSMLTSMKMPTLSSAGQWVQMFRGKKELDVYDTLRDDLARLTVQIIDINQKREFKCVDWDPRYTCISVAS